MGRAIVIACVVLLMGGVGCSDAPDDDAKAVEPGDGTEVTEAEKPETTTTTRPRPTTTTSTTTTTTTTTAPPTTTTTAPPPPPTTTAPPPPPTTAAPVAPANSCDPNYSGCVPVDSDVDCAGGSGNGPSYVQGPVTIIGTDIYDLDGNDNDGIGCES
ncbi:MAG TPA: hypothetical protein VGO60_08720 [Iamia sp.]|nr:hypothetical protein [Iamia sp.]